MQRDGELRALLDVERHPCTRTQAAFLQLTRSVDRELIQLCVGEGTLRRLDRHAIRMTRARLVDPDTHHGNGSLTESVSAIWTPAADYEDILYDLGTGENAGIAKITINRPEVRNAFRPETVIELSDAFDRAREDPSVGVIILTGAGELAFCSGGDQRVRGARGGYVTGADPAQAGHHDAVGRFHVTDLHVQIRRLPKPVVAMVAGYAVGGGHVLHIVCDLTIAADNARFGQTGPKVGSFDGGFGASVLSRLVGPKKAKEIWFLCRQYTAEAGAPDGACERGRPARPSGGGDRLLVPGDARRLAVLAATAEGELQCR